MFILPNEKRRILGLPQNIYEREIIYKHYSVEAHDVFPVTFSWVLIAPGPRQTLHLMRQGGGRGRIWSAVTPFGRT